MTDILVTKPDPFKSLGGGFVYFYIFNPNPGKMIRFDSYFSNGLVQPPTRKRSTLFFFVVRRFPPLSWKSCVVPSNAWMRYSLRRIRADSTVFCGDGETGPFLRAPEKTRGRFYWSFPESPRPFWDSLFFHDLWLDILDGNVLFRICFPHSLMAGWSHWVVKSLNT